MIKDEPRQDATVVVDVIVNGDVRHHRDEVHARLCNGEDRTQYAQEAVKLGPSEAFHRRLGQMPENEFQTGNMTACANPTVVRKILSDHHLCDRIDRNMFLEVWLVGDLLRTEDEGCAMPGYVQHIACWPMTLHLYTQTK